MLWESAPKEIPDIEQLLNELERLAPTIDMDESPRAIIFRNLEEDESINDALDDDMDEDVRSWIEWQAQAELPLVYSIDVSPTDVPAVPLVAVDTGVIRLGETEDGLII